MSNNQMPINMPINADELYARIGRLMVVNDKLNELIIDLQQQVAMLQQMLQAQQANGKEPEAEAVEAK